MDGVQVAVRVAPYLARPGRRALVALDLADLRGPVTGRVELPLRLFWSGTDRTFDVGDTGTRQWVYETVLQQASRPEDLTASLNGPALVPLWPKLVVRTRRAASPMSSRGWARGWPSGPSPRPAGSR